MKVYVTTAYTDDSGDHAIGDEVDFPNGTPEEKLVFERLLRYGLISTDKPSPVAPAPQPEKGRKRRT